MTRGEWAIVALLLVGGVPGLLSLSAVWSTAGDSSHGHLVPLVALRAGADRHAARAAWASRPIPRWRLALGGMAVACVGGPGFGDLSALGLLPAETVVVAVLAP